MKVRSSHRPLMLAQAGIQRELKTLFASAADQARAALITAMDVNGQIPAGRQRDVKMQVGRIVSDLFTPADNRSAYASDGVTPLAPYPRILNKWLAIATFFAVQQQEQWLRKHVPADVFAYLRTGRRSLKQVAETASEELLARAKEMRLFAPSPFTRIDPDRRWVPPHQWQDEKGYRLSDRIWRVDEETRRKIDEVLTQALRDGPDAIRISRMVAAYLNPTETRKTDKPYNVSVNYAAMRLARTEVSRAFNEAAFTAGAMNPYVNGFDLARSGNGDPSCPVCQQHATIDMGGNRVRQPYSMEGGARYAPLHPHCQCVVRVVTRDPKEVTAELRAAMQAAQAELNINPADARAMTIDLLGNWGDPERYAETRQQVAVRVRPAPVNTRVVMSYGEVERDKGLPGDTVDSLNAFLSSSDGPLARAIKATAGWDNPYPALDLDWDTNQYKINKDNVYALAKSFVEASRNTDYSGAYLVGLIQEKAAAAGVVVSDRNARALYNREYQAEARAILTLARIGKVRLTDPQMRYLTGAADGNYFDLSTTVEQARRQRQRLEMKGIGSANMTDAARAEMRRNFLEITGRLAK